MAGQLKEDIKNKARKMDIPLIGFASIDRWETPPENLPNKFEKWIPEDHWPQNIFKKTKTVIVIGEPVFYPIVKTAPSKLYLELYKNVNTILDIKAYELANFLNNKKIPSISLPRDGYSSIEELIENPNVFFSHKHAAYLAGLGSFGQNNVLLTKKYGPRVRFNSIFTSKEIEADEIKNEKICIQCSICVNDCPIKIIEPVDKNNPYLPLIDKVKCAKRSKYLRKHSYNPCGICIQNCPAGEDFKLHNK